LRARLISGASFALCCHRRRAIKKPGAVSVDRAAFEKRAIERLVRASRDRDPVTFRFDAGKDAAA